MPVNDRGLPRALAEAARPGWAWLVVLVAAAAPYLGVLDGAMVAGDLEFIAQNPLMHSSEPLADAFGHGYWFKGDASQPAPYYRPLVVLLDYLDHARFGLQPRGYHVTNLCLHGAASLSVLVLARMLIAPAWAGLASALVFAVHPIQVHAVAYISGRTSVMAALFAVLCIAMVLEGVRRVRAGGGVGGVQVGGVVFAALALLSKESAAPLPALAVAAVLLFGAAGSRPSHPSRWWRPMVGMLVGIAAVVILDLWLRALVLGQLGSPHRPLWARLDGLQSVLSMAKIVGFYPMKLLLPAELSYLPPFVPALSHFDVGGILWFAVLVAATLWVLWPRPGFPRARFCLFWFLACLLPVSGVVALEYFVKEHHAYLPAVGFVLLLGLGLERAAAMVGQQLPRVAKTAPVAGVLGLLLLAVHAAQHAQHFAGPRALYTRILSLEAAIPDAAFAHPAMSQTAHRYAIAHLNLGLLDRTDGHCTTAQPRFARAETLARNRTLRAQAAFLLGDCAAQLGDLAGAQQALARALDHDPTQTEIRGRLEALERDSAPR